MQIIWVNIRLHSSCVHSFAFFEIYYVKFDFLFTTIFYCEIKPLSMPSCIWIRSHKQIVFIFVYFDAYIQISTLKITVENKFLWFWYCWIHSFKYSCSFRFEIRVKFSKICCHMKIIWTYNPFFYVINLPSYLKSYCLLISWCNLKLF